MKFPSSTDVMDFPSTSKPKEDKICKKNRCLKCKKNLGLLGMFKLEFKIKNI